MMLVLIPFGKLQRHTLGETDDRRLRSHNEQHTPRQARFQKLDVVFTKEAPDLRCGMQARVMLKNPLMFVLNILSQYASVMSTFYCKTLFIPAQLKM
jgi:hypothetical protein